MALQILVHWGRRFRFVRFNPSNCILSFHPDLSQPLYSLTSLESVSRFPSTRQKAQLYTSGERGGGGGLGQPVLPIHLKVGGGSYDF